MAKQNFTAGRIDSFTCELGKRQTIHWDAKTPGFGLRVTTWGSQDVHLRITFVRKIDPRQDRGCACVGSGRARTEAARLKTLIDDEEDPREVRAEQQAVHEARQIARRRLTCSRF